MKWLRTEFCSVVFSHNVSSKVSLQSLRGDLGLSGLYIRTTRLFPREQLPRNFIFSAPHIYKNNFWRLQISHAPNGKAKDLFWPNPQGILWERGWTLNKNIDFCWLVHSELSLNAPSLTHTKRDLTIEVSIRWNASHFFLLTSAEEVTREL